MLSLPVADGPQGLAGHGTGPMSQDTSFQPDIYAARLAALRAAHEDLDDAIDALGGAHGPDDLIIARLKKRRLQIRDEIASLDAARSAAPDAPPAPDVLIGPAPRPIPGSSAFGVLAALFFLLLLLALSWSDLMESVNQTIAQMYLVSLVVAANG
jgi:hypothetical protein